MDWNLNRLTISIELAGEQRELIFRRPGVDLWLRCFGSLPDAELLAGASATDGDPSSPEAQKLLSRNRDLICECSIEPRLTTQNPPPDGAFYLDDVLDFGAFNAVTAKLIEDIQGQIAAARPTSGTPSSV